MQLHCVICGANSLRGYCFRHKPRKPMQTRKPMKKIGKVGQKLATQREVYLRAFPAPHYCYYCLYLGIEEELAEKHIQVEHFLTKNNRPGLRFDWSNLVKSCAGHNKLKSSMDGPEFLELLDQIRRV